MVVQAAMDSDVYFWWFVENQINGNMGDVISYLYLHFYGTDCNQDSKT